MDISMKMYSYIDLRRELEAIDAMPEDEVCRTYNVDDKADIKLGLRENFASEWCESNNYREWSAEMEELEEEYNKIFGRKLNKN
jgi:hypothetical protein